MREDFTVEKVPFSDFSNSKENAFNVNVIVSYSVYAIKARWLFIMEFERLDTIEERIGAIDSCASNLAVLRMVLESNDCDKPNLSLILECLYSIERSIKHETSEIQKEIEAKLKNQAVKERQEQESLYM